MKICMIVYSFYETDTRVMMYANALANMGEQVDVIALREIGQNSYVKINGVSVYRIQERERNEKGKYTYLYRLIKFFIKSFLFISYKHLKENYDLIHVHSVPDFEVFASLIPKLLGAKIILDIHDIVPEFYASKFGTKSKSFLFKLLVFTEKISIAFSDHVIISNHIWQKTLIYRSVKEDKCTTIINYPDNSIFFRRNSRYKTEKFLFIYPGTLNWHQGLDIAIKAFAVIKDEAPEAEFHIYGDGPVKNALIAMIRDLGLERRVFLKGIIPIDEIAEVMANADLGIIPKRNDFFGGEAFSTKTLEFMCSGVPIIVSKTKIDNYYFDESIVKFFRPEDEKDLADAMLLLIRSKKLREDLAERAFKFVEKNNWDVKKYIYLDLVDSLVGKEKR